MLSHTAHFAENSIHMNAGALEVRALGRGDIPLLMQLQHAARAGNEAALLPRSAEHYAHGMDAGHYHIGIYHGTELIAHARIGPDYEDSADPVCEAALSALMIAPAWRGCGLSRWLTELAIDRACRDAYHQLNARVLPDNTPMWHRLQKHGFVFTGSAKSHERPAEPDCHVYHYKRSLLENTPVPG